MLELIDRMMGPRFMQPPRMGMFEILEQQGPVTLRYQISAIPTMVSFVIING